MASFTKLPGVYFNETIDYEVVYAEKVGIPLFLVYTATAIEELDEKCVYFDNLNEYKTIIQGKNLGYSYNTIKEFLRESESGCFYVYSVKTNTADGWKNAIISTINIDEIKQVVFYEDANSTVVPIPNKITAIATALNTCAERGAPRVGYIIPHGSLKAAIDADENTAPEATVVTKFTEWLGSATGNGRICVMVDDQAGVMLGRCLKANYNENPGFAPIISTITKFKYNFTYQQMLALYNLGVMFIREEVIQGVKQYRINLGTTTNFKDGGADGLLEARNTVDELERQVYFAALPYVKAKEVSSTLKLLQTEINAIVNGFNTRQDTVKTGTKLTVFDNKDHTYSIIGTVQPIGCVTTIDVAITVQ